MDSFWKGKKVLITGHTGFKGSWMYLWLNFLGAKVIGYSLEPSISSNMFSLINLNNNEVSIYNDVRNKQKLKETLDIYEPEILFHLAAQPLVRESYKNPVETFETNVLGTVNILNEALNTDSVKVVVNVTSDKCYENKEWIWGYRENDSIGGLDPYSCSKGCSELITNSFRESFYNKCNKYLATVRAGNVIGGGDWSEDRIVPDIIRALISNDIPILRNPLSIRPWQFVLEPLRGYMMLAEKMYSGEIQYCEGWNFGPDDDHIINVSQLTSAIIELWGNERISGYNINNDNMLHEAQILKLDSSKAKAKLNWKCKLSMNETLEWTVDWYKAYSNKSNMKEFSLRQIEKYLLL